MFSNLNFGYFVKTSWLLAEENCLGNVDADADDISEHTWVLKIMKILCVIVYEVESLYSRLFVYMNDSLHIHDLCLYLVIG